MSMIIGIIIAFTFFDWPWRAVILVAFLLFDFAEIYVWLRWRKKRSVSGPEGLIGARGKALTDLNPEGQVRLNGQTWTAFAPMGVSAGDDVEVEATQDLTLHVRKA